jgi:hypothetical protein
MKTPGGDGNCNVCWNVRKFPVFYLASLIWEADSLCCFNIFALQGVATYCKDAFTPFRAEEGLSGLFASSDAVDSVGCYGNIRAEFSKMELKELDYEGRAVITQHKIRVSCMKLLME